MSQSSEFQVGKLSSFKKGTKVYNWEFLHPDIGWVGGHKDENWHADKSTIEPLLKFCRWPTRYIEKVA